MKGDLLFLAHRIPYPPDRGDKIRAFHLLKHLAQGRRVHLIAFADDPRDLAHRGALAQWTASCTLLPRTKPKWRAGIEALATGQPISLTAFADHAMARAVTKRLADARIDTIFVFSGQMAQYLPPSSGCRVVMDFCDMDSAKFASYAQGGALPMRWLMAREGRRLQAFETDVAARADASLFVSAAEADLFARATGFDAAIVVENGIDTAYFDPAAAFEREALGERGIVFTGQMDYPPNIDAVTWFADTIFPGVLARHPDARFVIVGRAPTAAVSALSNRPGITVTGEVSDVRGWLAGAAVAVAPLRVARGVQNKVLEAMAMARPVVVSRAAAEGIDDGGTIRVADDDGFVEHIEQLFADPTTAAHLGTAARARVRQRYSWDARLAPLDAIVDPELAAA